jgi:curved DNA-binding protein CbpA
MQAAAEARGGGERVPHLVDGWENQGLRLTPSEGFLLSRIDGATPWSALRQIAGLPPEQVDACLERWIAQGIVGVLERAAVAAPETAAAPAASPAEPAAALDDSLEIPLELQRRILDFEAGLDRPYHELLGVEPDADLRTIKRAFFALSKDFHPDRYFRRRTGPFGPRLERIFKRIALAYELLADPTTRAELALQSAAAAPPAPAAADAEPAAAGAPATPDAPRRSRRRETLDRLRRHFRIPEEVLAERRLKARRLREAARVAAARTGWSEAASAIRLAIAFDPWDDEYKEAFGEIQAELNQLRAAELLERAGGASAGGEALRLLEEAVHYRPSDAKLQHRAAEAALEAGDVARAREYAERAVELDPDTAAHHATLGRVLRRVGDRRLAHAAFERAQRLEPEGPRGREGAAAGRGRNAARAGGGGAR